MGWQIWRRWDAPAPHAVSSATYGFLPAESIHGAIRGAILERYGRERADAVRIIYGGSVNEQNVDSLVSKPDIDGALVGGASLKADSFARIVRARTR